MSKITIYYEKKKKNSGVNKSIKSSSFIFFCCCVGFGRAWLNAANKMAGREAVES
jgi:hypothetical protein